MRAFGKFAAAALALAAPISTSHAQGPVSGLRPSEPAAIVAAAQSCRDAVTAERLDEQRLTADGWSLAQLSQNGQAAQSPLRLFGRETVLLIAMPEGSGCAVMARLRSVRHYSTVIAGLASAFGRPARTQSDGEALWVLADGRAIQANATGSRERPSIRIVIIHAGTEPQ